MEVEFDVKMEAGILYDYMMHHTYSSFAGICGSAAGALFLVAFYMNRQVIFLIAGLVILLYQPWALFLRSRQQMLKNPAFKKPLHYKLTEEGIEVSQDGATDGQKWEDMYKAVSTNSSIVVYTSRINACIFPKKDIGEQKYKVIEIISTHMPAKKVKIRG
ncbi:MAG: YcxB family protein [Blautia sp.]|nr:YcxB family protein [Lachnoclostridium sp.]MCM1210327.1 YcxB family protein [Blautia sp.]